MLAYNSEQLIEYEFLTIGSQAYIISIIVVQPFKVQKQRQFLGPPRFNTSVSKTVPVIGVVKIRILSLLMRFLTA